jgi:hypothetical protein
MQILQDSTERVLRTIDKSGRTLVIHRPTALDTLRLFKAAGPNLAQNEAWLAMAGLACAVREIDGIPSPMPVNEAQIEALVSKLGDVGLEAIAALLDANELSESVEIQAGNSRGTPF